jgi:ligand-binding SRPBCC domain-containing protein
VLTLNISTEVDGNFRAVFQGFSRDLFLRLNLPLPPVKLLRFDGMGVGDEVHLELNFIFFRQRWISRITAFEESENEIFFVDEGIQLPFFLQSWRHCHRIVDRQGQATIIDEITFQAPNRLLSLLLLPTLYLQFLYRKPIYKRFFSDLQATG